MQVGIASRAVTVKALVARRCRVLILLHINPARARLEYTLRCMMQGMQVCAITLLHAASTAGAMSTSPVSGRSGDSRSD
jgi:hypothetical protein